MEMSLAAKLHEVVLFDLLRIGSKHQRFGSCEKTYRTFLTNIPATVASNASSIIDAGFVVIHPDGPGRADRLAQSVTLALGLIHLSLEFYDFHMTVRRKIVFLPLTMVK
jgi:hypothetical protein